MLSQIHCGSIFRKGGIQMHLPELFQKRMQQLLQDDYNEFLQGYELPLRRGLRVNTAKIAVSDFLTLFPHPLEVSPFAENSFYLDSEHKAGSDPLHHAGAYYMQEPSASSAVTVLAPQRGERILDLCAAPGGKSTQIAACIGDDGLLWSNEYVSARARILQQNLERWGVRNSVVSSRDTGPLCDGLRDYFDAVLVDAPCSGEGMFRKEPQALTEWSVDNIRLCAARQDEILHNASKAVRPGGRIVYSTCTFAPEENEGAVCRFLESHPDFYLEPIQVEWGCAGFSADRILPFCPEIETRFDTTQCRRILPQHGGEGHFIALLRRKDTQPRIAASEYNYPAKDSNRPAAEQLYRECFTDAPNGTFITFGDQVRLLPSDLPDCNGLGVLSAGVAVAAVCKNRLEPAHSIFVASRCENCRRTISLPPTDTRLTAFLHGEEISCDGENGWTTVCVYDIPVGFGKVSNGKLKNRYPKGLRLL